jgi:hypothetical protein
MSVKLSAYMDGELAPKDQAAVEQHLAACPECAARLRGLSAVDAGLKRSPDVIPSPFFTARVSAAARSLNVYHGPFRRFLRVPVPAMALMVAFILINLFTFAFNINAMENGPRRELARKLVVQLTKPSSIINPVALSRLCGECNKYMCLCMHEAGKQNICPCKDCQMKRMQQQTGPGTTGTMENMEEQHAN